MAGILEALRLGVRIANNVTQDAQCTVTYKKAVPDSTFGGVSYPSAVPLKALVDWKQTQVRTMTGLLSVSRAVVTFLDVDALSSATNGDGIDDKDIIILPDGTTGPILDLAGFIDAGTAQPLATEVFLG